MNKQTELLLRSAHDALDKMQNRINELERAQFEPLAVIGMACRGPDGIDSLDDYWSYINQNRRSTASYPIDRWGALRGIAETEYALRISCMKNVDQFDAEFFNISPREADEMDPQQRIMLHVCYEALEHAGVCATRYQNELTGVFVGIMNNDYVRLQTRCQHIADLDAYHGIGSAFSFTAGRLSYHLGLQGPSMAVDTACSSSLVCVDLAAKYLRDRECDMAIVGGVNLILSPDQSVTLTKSGALSMAGHCETFSQGADGYGRSEGCGVVVLTRLSDAVQKGDHIYGVVKSSVTNHGGQGAGITMPNPKAQKALVKRGISKAGLVPSDIDYIEAHGTGTELGDPIEIHALQDVFHDHSKGVLLGCVKANLGHMESAAGIMGLIKACLILDKRQFPPLYLSGELSEHIDWNNSSLRVSKNSEPWHPGDRKRAIGINSFGMGGTNAHVIVQEYESSFIENKSAISDTKVMLFSARTERDLAKWIDVVEKAVRKNPEKLDAYASCSVFRRERYAYTKAIVYNDIADFKQQMSKKAYREYRPSDADFPGEWEPLPAYPWHCKSHWVRTPEFTTIETDTEKIQERPGFSEHRNVDDHEKESKSLLTELSSKPTALHHRIVKRHLAGILCEVLRFSEKEILARSEMGLDELGIDSIAGQDFISRVEKHIDSPIDVSALYEHSNLEMFSSYVLTAITTDATV